MTHYWSNNWNKGFDIYERVNTLLGQSPWKEQVEFTYIGRIPEGFHFQHTTYLPPQSGVELAESLRSGHVYLTAAQNEAAGMHHIEGALCGLPLLYRESGALPEYCQGFGIAFTSNDFEQKLHEMMNSYDAWVARMAVYPHSAEQMSEQYYKLFVDLLEHRDEIVRRRPWWRRFFWTGARVFKALHRESAL